MWTSTFYNYWGLWELNHKVVFDGPNKLIRIAPEITEIDVKEDIYSDWKEWMLGYDGLINAKFLQTGRAVGGDPLPGNRFLGSTFFLVNGWKVKLADGDYRLTVNGNLYTEEGDDPFIAPDSPASKVTVVQTVSTLVETIGIAEALNITIDEVRDALWTTTLSVLASGDNAAAQIERIKSETGLIPAII